jgi:hypothetical protein
MQKNIFKEEIMSDILNDVDASIVWEKLMKYKQSGMDKDTMYNALDSLRLEMRQKGDEKTEDAIMEYMDLVTGWCHPKWKIFP